MATIKDYTNPSFSQFPYHTDRTAWRPFGLPMILVSTHVRNAAGQTNPGSEILGVRIYITAKSISPVAGHDHVGIFNPDEELYNYNVPISDLMARKVDMNDVVYLDDDNNTVTSSEATFIQFTCRTGILDKIEYIATADYYDISDITIPTAQLPPDSYVLSYEATFYLRITSDIGELLCIDTNTEVHGRTTFLLRHPGEVLLQMVEGTPGIYFTDSKLENDTTVAFYRPFSDILQDIHDEQSILERSNWVYDIPAENVPYLGFLLGWDLPYFPKSIDNLRRAVLRNTVKLQQLKGSKRAVRELFNLFGFMVNIANVWWTPDGKKFLAPGEHDPDYEITTENIATTEPILLEYTTDGYGQLNAPVINRPIEQNMTVRAYLVQHGSAAHTFLVNAGTALTNNFEAYDYELPHTYITLSSAVTGVESLSGIVGSTTALLDQTGYVSSITTTGDAPIYTNGLKFNYVSNVLDLTFSKYIEFTKNDTSIFMFVTYGYEKITIPASMQNLQSNRFDIEILDKEGEQVDPHVVLFLIDFLFKIKAFHSLLRKIIIEMLPHDTYQVTDFCLGGLVQQSINSDAGQQQVPPEAIIPTAPSNNCAEFRPEDYGFRRWDLAYRAMVLGDLAAEFEAWAALSPNCAFNYSGQDRTTETRTLETSLSDGVRSDQDAPRATHCNLDGTDYCYEGRPKDGVSYENDALLPEFWQFKMCSLGLGYGVYYTYPGLGFLNNPVTNPYIGSDGITPKYNNWLGHLYRAYGRTQQTSLHFSNIHEFDDSSDPTKWLALQRPQLNIQKDNLNFPGHRLPTIGALSADYVDGSWLMKPWDYPITCSCGKVEYPNPLNAHIELDTNGNEKIVFDSLPYTLQSNGLLPDIYNLSEHMVGTGTNIQSADDVTHTIYADITGGHPAITLDGVTDGSGIQAVTGVKFGSGVECGTTPYDYIEGYPATWGWVATPTVDYFPWTTSDLADELGIPGPGTGTQLLFTLSSEILVDPASFTYDWYRPVRTDCGCAHLECDGSSLTPVPAITTCTTASFIAQYGNAEPDQVDIESSLVLLDTVDTPLNGVDDEDSSLFNLKQSLGSSGWVLDLNGSTGPNPWPDSGSFIYKDNWGTIYETEWETIGSYLDIVLITKEPRVWGVSSNAGRVVNREVYRTGTITTTRQVYLKVGDVWQLVAEGSEQVIGEFKSTYVCNPPFSDPFINHLNNNIQDFFEFEVVGSGSGSGSGP